MYKVTNSTSLQHFFSLLKVSVLQYITPLSSSGNINASSVFIRGGKA